MSARDATVTVKGDVDGNVNAHENSKVTVEGNVQGQKDGRTEDEYGEDDYEAAVDASRANVTVHGDVSGNVHSYALVTATKADKTVYIDGEEKNYVDDTETAQKQQAEINYIIRHEGTISLEGTRLTTVNGNSYETAHENETLTIHVEVDDKHRVDSVEGGSATATRNEDGSWTLVVPKNGGVDIRAVLAAIEETKDTSNDGSNSSDSSNSSSTSSSSNSSSGSSSSSSRSSGSSSDKTIIRIATTTDGATVMTSVDNAANGSTTSATITMGSAKAKVNSTVTKQNGVQITMQSVDGMLAGASFAGLGQISADGATLTKTDGSVVNMAPGQLYSIVNEDGSSLGCFLDKDGKAIATGSYVVYYMFGTDGQLHAHFVDPQGYFLAGTQVINGQTVTFNTVGEMISVQ